MMRRLLDAILAGLLLTGAGGAIGWTWIAIWAWGWLPFAAGVAVAVAIAAWSFSGWDD